MMDGSTGAPQATLALYPPPVFDPLASLMRMTMQKADILQMLAEERARAAPREAVIEALETWLRVYHLESQRAAALTNYRISREAASAAGG